MDFFEAQALAKQRTARLVALFALAVLGTTAAGYFAFIALTAAAGVRATSNGGGLERDLGDLAHLQLWQPGALIAFTLLTLVVVGLSALGKWLQLRAGGRAIAALVGARELPPQSTVLRERQLLNIVEEMSIASGLPMPSVFVLDKETGINAFAAGLTTSDAVVTVTQGTLDKLTRDELQGVVAHEFSHILNGDMRLNVRLTAILHGILVVGLIGRGILSGLGNVRVRSSNRDKNGGGLIILIFAVGLVMIALGYVGYFFGRLIQAAVSRQRELLADASAVQFTRNPAGISGALKKIGGYSLGSQVHSSKSSEISHFFFAQGFRSAFGGLWATHPPLDQRIRAIDPSFDGHFIESPAEADISAESGIEATSAFRSAAVRAAPARSTTGNSRDPHQLVAAIGTLTPAHIERAQLLAQFLPNDLRAATRTPSSAAALVCGLLLATDDDALRARQHALIRRLSGEAIALTVISLETSLRALPQEARLPLLQLTPPALRQLPPAELSRLLETLDELVHADQQVSLFEFALQKVLSRHLALAAAPSGQREVYSPADVSAEISAVLSFAAWLSATADAVAQDAFNSGATIFSGIYPELVLSPCEACTLVNLDRALDRLALTFGPVKKRLLTALALTVCNDGQVDPAEADLLRALSSALDCPMPLGSV